MLILVHINTIVGMHVCFIPKFISIISQVSLLSRVNNSLEHLFSFRDVLIHLSELDFSPDRSESLYFCTGLRPEAGQRDFTR